VNLDEHLAYLRDLAKRNEERAAKQRAAAQAKRPWVPPNIPEQRAFEAARAEMYESQIRLARAQAQVRHRHLSAEQRQVAQAMLRSQKAATRLAVKAMVHAANVRNDAEKALERRARR
jgi:hypothetical protein